MLLSTAITRVLTRSGKSVSDADLMTVARDYISMTVAEVIPLVDWWWLDRTTTFKTTRSLTITGVTGTYTSGETVTDGQASAYSATVDNYDATNGILNVYSENDVTPTGTLTGGSSGATSTYSSRAFTRSYQPISGQVTAWWSAVDETNNRPLDIVGPDFYDNSDPDRDSQGSVYAVLVAGLDATTGYPVLDLINLPSTTNETMRIRYRQEIGIFASTDDATDLSVLGLPRIMENVVIYGGVHKYLEQNGDDEGSFRELANFDRAMAAAKKQNLNMQGNRRYLPSTTATRPLIAYPGTLIEGP